jgi:transcriptional regulator with XRE-family HTH domain
MTFRQLLREAGMTGYRLAKLSGVEQTTISQLELGKVRDPRWSTLAALAGALDIAPGTVAKAIAETPKRPTPKRSAGSKRAPAKRRIA